MNGSYRFTRLAENDLETIIEYSMATYGPERADETLSEFLDAISHLAAMPGMGHSRPELVNAEILFWVIGRYLIAYQVEAGYITVIRILHGVRHPTLLRHAISFHQVEADEET